MKPIDSVVLVNDLRTNLNIRIFEENLYSLVFRYLFLFCSIISYNVRSAQQMNRSRHHRLLTNCWSNRCFRWPHQGIVIAVVERRPFGFFWTKHRLRRSSCLARLRFFFFAFESLVPTGENTWLLYGNLFNHHRFLSGAWGSYKNLSSRYSGQSLFNAVLVKFSPRESREKITDLFFLFGVLF